MTKDELQNKIWASLSDDLKAQLRIDYKKALDAFKFDPKNVRIETHINFLKCYFGESNLITTDNEPTPKFKVGDKVVVSKNMSWGNECSESDKYQLTHFPSEITDIGGGYANIKSYCDIYGFIPLAHLIPYTEPTAMEDEEKEHNISETVKDSVDWMRKLDKVVEEYKTAFSEIVSDDWQDYRMELAAKIAVAYAEKGSYEPSEIGVRAVEVANWVVERLKKSKV